MGGLVGEHALATMGWGRCGVRAPLGAWRRTSGRRKGLAARQHRTDGRGKGLAVVQQQKGVLTKVGRAIMMVLIGEMGKTCLAGMTALCEPGGRAAILCSIGASAGKCRGCPQNLGEAALVPATAASSLSVRQHRDWWCARPEVGVTCDARERQQKGVLLRAGRADGTVLKEEMGRTCLAGITALRKPGDRSAVTTQFRSITKPGAAASVQVTAASSLFAKQQLGCWCVLPQAGATCGPWGGQSRLGEERAVGLSWATRLGLIRFFTKRDCS